MRAPSPAIRLASSGRDRYDRCRTSRRYAKRGIDVAGWVPRATAPADRRCRGCPSGEFARGNCAGPACSRSRAPPAEASPAPHNANRKPALMTAGPPNTAVKASRLLMQARVNDMAAIASAKRNAGWQGGFVDEMRHDHADQSRVVLPPMIAAAPADWPAPRTEARPTLPSAPPAAARAGRCRAPDRRSRRSAQCRSSRRCRR